MVYALLIGQLTLMSFIFSDDLGIQLVMVFMSTGYSAGASSRNAGRPLLAIMMLVLCSAPLSFAVIFEPTMWVIVVAFSNALYIGVMGRHHAAHLQGRAGGLCRPGAESAHGGSL